MHLDPEYGTLFNDYPDAGEVLDKARDFRRRFIDPVAHELDQRLLLDPHYSPDEIIHAACDYGFFSLPIPSFLGGGGKRITHVCLLLEELCAGCAGIANIIGAHYLGLTGIMLSLDLYHYDRFLREVVRQERRGIAKVLAGALTEPTAGTDVMDSELLAGAKLMTSAKKVAGGYLLNGRKVFISNGSIAAYYVVVCALDRERPVETLSAFTVPSETKGFSIGRVELKMGQRACHAAELVFEDCFLPTELRIGAEGKAALATDVVFAASRGPVAAIATGIARGAYERALQYACTRQCAGRPLIESQWVQQTLGDMHAKIQASRQHYIAAARWSDMAILNALLSHEWLINPVMRLLGPLRRTRLGKKVTSSETCRRLTSAYAVNRLITPQGEVASGLSSLAKFSCSDMALQVCLQALDLMGHEGALEHGRIEKLVRDAKLTQIYEGTNQLMRYEVYKNFIREVTE